MVAFLSGSIPSTIDGVDDKGPPREPDRTRTRPLAGRRRAHRLARFEAMQTFATVGTVGLSFVFAIAIGVAVGLWLDRVTGWSPFFFFAFFLCGLAAGILNVYRTLSRYLR